MTDINREVFYDARWTAAAKIDLGAAAVATWDPTMARDVRLLVPIDVQALVVAPGAQEPMVRLVSPANAPDGQGAGFPAPFDPGAPRPAGVHLHWAMPDALLRGTFGDAAATAAAGNALGLRPLPDRWVVLRLLTPAGSTVPAVRGWVLEADTARVTALADWPTNAAASPPLGAPIAPDRLDGAAGGAVTWTTTYDSVVGRFALHDPLDDLAAVAPQGVDGGAATYVVAGWWSQPALDPLDAARDRHSLDELLHGLGWTAVPQWTDAGADQRNREALTGTRRAAGLFAKALAQGAPPATPPAATRILTAFDRPASATFAANAAAYRFVAWWPHASLLHGAVYGVPVAAPGAAPDPVDPALDNRPAPGDVRLALGAHDDDVIGALVSTSLADADDEARRNTERVLSAFTGQLLRDLDTPDGAVAVEEHEHHAGFGSLPGGSLGTDRLLSGRSRTSRTAGRGARQRQGALHAAPGVKTGVGEELLVASSRLFRDRRELLSGAVVRQAVRGADAAVPADAAVAAEPRVVEKQAPRYHFPLDPLVAVQGARRSLRHGNDARFSADGLMWCRWPYQTQRQWKGLVRGDQLIATLGNGAVPDEVLLLAQEAILCSPSHRRWLAAVAAASSGVAGGLVRRRFAAEDAVRFGAAATYDGRTSVLGAAGLADHVRADVFDQALAHSQLEGAEPYPLGVTLWSQPWVPTWMEWEAEVAATPTLDGWTLGPVDLAAADPVAALGGAVTTHVGRSMLSTGAARTLSSAVADFLAAEDKLEQQTGGLGEVDDDTERALAAVATASAHLDLQTAPLDGLRLTWLGLEATVDGVARSRTADGASVAGPAPTGPPEPLVSGSVRLRSLRLLDTFGRTVDLTPRLGDVAVATRNDAPTAPGALALYPRLPRPARWMFRLVDAATAVGAVGADAFVDQVDPAAQVNPVAGFVLPDHLDESLELFDTAGQPVGELFHAAISGQVVWEIAPGRAGPPDAGPLFDLAPAHAPLGRFAGGLVAADVRARAEGTGGAETALSAALRAIDTTLWTVDTFAAMGSEHIAGLVGRPIAVVRAQLWLELRPEDAYDLSDPDRAAERAAAERELAAVAFPVRLGELTRVDDGLLGFFVDDDYEHFRIVDKTVKDMAKPAGPTGQRSTEPAPIGHPYLQAEDTLYVHHGQRLTLTLLMHPAARVHLTSGVLPRKALELARDWVAPGLGVLSPSLRTGPLLIDPDKVRLPKPTVFGAKQRFTRRVTTAAWQDDPILAATQTALLPDGATSVQEGYIRVMPDEQAPS